MKKISHIQRCLPSLATIVVILSAFCADAYADYQNRWTGNVNLFLGGKFLEESEWRPAHEQDEWGIELDFRQEGWPVNIAIDYLRGDISESDFDPVFGSFIEAKSETAELNIGVRKIWDHFPRARPFIGGGISYITAESIVFAPGIGSFFASDEAVGAWIGGGVYWEITRSLNLGFEIKYSFADVTIGGVDVDAGGEHFGLLFGYHW